MDGRKMKQLDGNSKKALEYTFRSFNTKFNNQIDDMEEAQDENMTFHNKKSQNEAVNDGKTPQSAHIIFDYSSESESESETSSTSKTESPTEVKPMCEVCTKNVPKYTCPGCGVRTCCLACVNDHKMKLNCNGQRNNFVTLDKSEYSDMHLLNDYRFLENAERTVYSNKDVPRNRGLVHPNGINPYGYGQRKKSRILMSAAEKRGVYLKVFPGLERHKSNTSFYTISSDTLEWAVEWLFVSSNCLIKDEKVLESAVLLGTVKKFGNAVNYPHLRKTLEDYRKKFHLCHYFIKVEGLPANLKRFVQLNPSQTLGENLKGLCFVEFPTIYVVQQGYKTEEFLLLEKDDLPNMQPAVMRHLTTKHPAFSDTECLEEQILDPASGVYQPDKTEKDNISDKIDHLAKDKIHLSAKASKVCRLLNNLNQITNLQKNEPSC